MKRIQVIIAFSLFFYVTVFGQNDYRRRPFPFKDLSTEFQKEVNNSKPRIFYLFSSACSGAYDPLLVGNHSRIQLGTNYKWCINRQKQLQNTDRLQTLGKSFITTNSRLHLILLSLKLYLSGMILPLVWVNSEGEI